jgi:poly-gamma-glutamate capsule biosynthesis protein CapA/YwtB (metallophosphatase superfamily)
MLIPCLHLASGQRTKRLVTFWLLSITLVLSACAGPIPSPVSPSLTPDSLDETATPDPPLPTRSSPKSQPTDPPRAFVLKVPAEWAQVAAKAISQVNETDDQYAWQLDVGQPTTDDLEAGWADAVLIEGEQGTIVASRPIALAVPFTTIWDSIALEEAKAILTDGSDFIQPIDWSEMQPELKSVLVDGSHPSDPEYPLRRSWSLHSSAEAQAALNHLLPTLRAHIQNDSHIELAAVGDLMLARTIGSVLQSGDLAYPFEFVAPELQQADLAIGNLESALGTGGVSENKGYTFRAPPQAAPALALAGFDLLSLANNHAMDYGPKLLLEAITALQTHGIATTGAGVDEAAAHQPFLVEINDLQAAFLSFVDVPQEFRGFDTRSWQAGQNLPGLAWADPTNMRVAIEAARQEADLVIVLLHSGFEYVPQPSPAQINAARTAIEAGADLVLGHHAHLLQPIEFHPQGVIVYGLGNFVFEDAGPPESALLKVWLDSDGVRELQFLPVRLDDSGRPVPVSGDLAHDILASLNSFTKAWKTQTPTQDP